MKAVQHVELKLANLVICGVNKAGSTSLFSYLADHPEICPSKVKETQFFRPVLYNEPLPHIREYGKFFVQNAKGKYTLEADPRYFYGKAAIARSMKKHLPEDLKVIVLLRDPVRRFVSFYKFKYFNHRSGVRNMSFEKFLNHCFKEYEERKDEPFIRNDYLYVRALKEGIYIDFLRDWKEEFGNNIKIYFFDDLKDQPQYLMRDICQWLGISGGCYAHYDFTHENMSVPPKNMKVHMAANLLNEKFISFWLKQPSLKKKVRKYYYKLNTANKINFEVSEKSLLRLNEFYWPANQELKAYLQTQGLNNLPNWLR